MGCVLEEVVAAAGDVQPGPHDTCWLQLQQHTTECPGGGGEQSHRAHATSGGGGGDGHSDIVHQGPAPVLWEKCRQGIQLMQVPIKNGMCFWCMHTNNNAVVSLSMWLYTGTG
jgi:hypothetical protein